MDTKYYVVELNYVGPKNEEAQRGKSMFVQGKDCVLINTRPPRSNSQVNGEYPEVTSGWLGTTNEWAAYAHGAYDSVQEARDAIPLYVDEVSSLDDLRDNEDIDHDIRNAMGMVEAYYIGKYEPLDWQGTEDWLFQCLASDTRKGMSELEIQHLADAYEAEANGEGYTLTGTLNIITDFVAELEVDNELE